MRIENRVRKGGHDIPADDVQRRFDKRFEDLIKILPHCDRAQFVDNENGFNVVGSYSEGKLTLMGEYRPNWILTLKEIMEKRI